MENMVLTCGFTEQEKSLLAAVLPVEYEMRHTEDVTDMIVTSALCYIVSGETLDGNEYRLLRNYCVEVGEYGNERIFWIGDDPPCEMVTVYGSVLDLMLDIENALKQAQEHHDTQAMYCSEYAVLPGRAIADSLEQDIFAAYERAFKGKMEVKIQKQLRQEWTAVLEVSGASELAAVYELSQWLKRKSIPYFMEGSVTSGLIPFLLGITRTNPLPKQYGGHDLVWQSFCAYGQRPTYVFHLPEGMKPQIEKWNEHHWLKQMDPEVSACCQHSKTDIRAIRFLFDAERVGAPAIPNRCREDIFHCLVQNGFIEKDAVRGMEVITLGGYVPPAMTNAINDYELRRAGLPSRAELTERYLFATVRQDA